MKAKILMAVMLVCVSAVVLAQPAQTPAGKFQPNPRRAMAMRAQHAPAQGLNLTDAQKTAFKQSAIALQKQLQPLRNELREAMAHQRTLVTAEKPDMGAINKNLDKMGAIRVEMLKVQTKHRLEMRAQLTDEQRLKFDTFHGKMMQKNRENHLRNRPM